MSLSVNGASVLLAATNWWEPGTPGLLDVGDVSAIFGFLIALTGATYGLTKWWMKLMRKMMREEIEIATEPIQPHANGGLSLADVARRTQVLETEMCSLNKKTDKLQKTVSESNELLIRFLNETTGSTEIHETMASPSRRGRSKK